MKANDKSYPENLRQYVYGFGGVRVYKVTKAEAKSIAKEFHLKLQPLTKRTAKHFYINVNHGEQHILFYL